MVQFLHSSSCKEQNMGRVKINQSNVGGGEGEGGGLLDQIPHVGRRPTGTSVSGGKLLYHTGRLRVAYREYYQDQIPGRTIPSKPKNGNNE
ncbi:hypothetical protein J6590_023508 [Homalodisca vitripennis]|nr:hypothetical protein J6590_023508 [Homalodisca vitripennis]